MEKVNCIICNKNNNKSLLSYALKDSNGNKFYLTYCNTCDFSYLDPRPSKKDISFYYDTNYHPYQNRNKNIFTYIYRCAQTITFYWKRRVIRKFSYNGRKLLDIGAGSNNFITYISRFKYSCSSYDEFSSGVDYNSLNQIHKKKYDHITLWHSIEHIHDIDILFKTIVEISKDTTYLYIACPNYNAIERTLLHENWPAYDPPRHLYHFTFNSMQKLLRKYNFKIISTSIMLQDTFFNILLSKNINIIRKIYLIIYSITVIMFNKKNASSILYICKLN
jgi:hypothetical protein